MGQFQIIRATELWQQTGAYYVRIQGMGRQHNISLREEFDEHDGPDTKYIVILDGLFPIATARFYELDDKTVMIGRVVVLPEYRGKGLGSMTIKAAEEWIRELGYRHIRIDARDVAVGFYEKLGFSAREPLTVEWGNFRCIRMEKDIFSQTRAIYERKA
ncbi:MAG: GNAT family N-acetyltransferase [Lachnospiraceae bacterium]|nr:GNAT family N-acetyltransferase [Lachnospiraceae bacterium]